MFINAFINCPLFWNCFERFFNDLRYKICKINFIITA